METRSTSVRRKDFLYLLPLIAIVVGIILMPLANAVPSGSFFDWFFWDGGLVLIGAGILGGLIELGLILWRVRITKTPQ